MASIYKISCIRLTLLFVSFIVVSSLPLIQDKRILDNKMSRHITQGLSNLFDGTFRDNQELIVLKRTRRYTDDVLDRSSNNQSVHLLSKSHHFLGMFKNGTVYGFPTKSNHTLVQLQSFNSSIVRLKSLATGLYIGMNRKGKVIGMQKKNSRTLWKQTMEQNFFIIFQSVWHLNKFNSTNKYFLGVKSSGKTKRGKNTLPGMKSVQFLVVSSDDVSQNITK